MGFVKPVVPEKWKPTEELNWEPMEKWELIETQGQRFVKLRWNDIQNVLGIKLQDNKMSYTVNREKVAIAVDAAIKELKKQIGFVPFEDIVKDNAIFDFIMDYAKSYAERRKQAELNAIDESIRKMREEMLKLEGERKQKQEQDNPWVFVNGSRIYK